jgi:hypothetical protein
MMVEQSMTLAIVLAALFIRMLGRSETEQLRRERLEDRDAEAAAYGGRLALEDRAVRD